MPEDEGTTPKPTDDAAEASAAPVEPAAKPEPDEAAAAAPEAAADPETTAAAPKPEPKPKPPPRPLPSHDDIAAWIEGEDRPLIAALFNTLPVVKFDALVMQIRKAELLAQHWQVISSLAFPDESEFDSLPEAGRLRIHYRDQEVSRRRLDALRAAWVELRGKQPSLWQVPDLFAAMRRLIEKKADVDFHELLSAVRDVWATMSVPAGREQLEILWACLDFIRTKTKK